MTRSSPAERHLLHLIRLRNAAASLTADQLDACATVLCGAAGQWTRDHVVACLQGRVDVATEQLREEQEDDLVAAAPGRLDHSRN